ncbi:ESX secretion-associated protein EspG [Nocardia sp. NPDC006044]|uniref:ESX secretion-associated protein EspG n=1 Tax=Nocardia sp. NPDC006044 TaxID=3364306 RepID=UPI0036ACEAF0
MNADPVAINLNVDAALLLQDMVGIDSYPAVLALMPNIEKVEDRDRVHAVVAADLAEKGVITGDRVHPMVEHWLRCLYRPDMELVGRIVSIGRYGEPDAMLRLSLVRGGGSHVLALRCDDEVVIQSVFQEDRQLDTVAAVVGAALGPYPALQFNPLTATLEEFTAVPTNPADRPLALLELGASSQTATVLTRALDEIVCRAEILMTEHRDGGSVETPVCLSVLDTLFGRIVVTPGVALDGEVRSTYRPGDDEALQAGIAALVDLLPGRSWFGTSRIS